MKWLKYVMLLAAASLAAITKITLPTDFNTVANGTRANLSSNFSEIDTRSDAAFDSVDEVRGRMTGYTGDFTITSLDHLRLRLDSDGSLLGRFFISNGSTGDSLWRISEDSTWRAFGAGTGTKLTLSDSILAATARISGNGTFGGTLGVTGASTLAALSATTGSFSSTLAVTGGTTFGGTVRLNNANNIQWLNASAVTRNILALNSSNNLEINGTGDGGINFFVGAGSNGGTVSSAGAWALPSTLGVTGNLTLSTLSSGRIPVVSTAGLITQGHFYADNVNARLGIGSGASAPGFDLDVSKSSVGGTVQFGLSNTDNTNTASHARMQITGGGASGGDAALLFTLAGVGSNWAMGLDNSDADAFVISGNSSLGTSNALRIASGGAVTIPGTLGVTGAITGSNLSGTNTGDQTNISGNAATVTTNANLTGPITSTGNATAIASQTGTGTTFMMSASPTTTGTLTAAAITASGAVSTGALTATTATLGGGEAFTYGDTTFTLTATGMTTSPTGTARGTRIGRIVTLLIPHITGTSNSSLFSLTGLPASWAPVNTQEVAFGTYQNNGTTESGGFIVVSTDLSISRRDAAAWTASGVKSIGNTSTTYATTITYQLQ